MIASNTNIRPHAAGRFITNSHRSAHGFGCQEGSAFKETRRKKPSTVSRATVSERNAGREFYYGMQSINSDISLLQQAQTLRTSIVETLLQIRRLALSRDRDSLSDITMGILVNDLRLLRQGCQKVGEIKFLKISAGIKMNEKEIQILKRISSNEINQSLSRWFFRGQSKIDIGRRDVNNENEENFMKETIPRVIKAGTIDEEATKSEDIDKTISLAQEESALLENIIKELQNNSDSLMKKAASRSQNHPGIKDYFNATKVGVIVRELLEKSRGLSLLSQSRHLMTDGLYLLE